MGTYRGILRAIVFSVFTTLTLGLTSTSFAQTPATYPWFGPTLEGSGDFKLEMIGALRPWGSLTAKVSGAAGGSLCYLLVSIDATDGGASLAGQSTLKIYPTGSFLVPFPVSQGKHTPLNSSGSGTQVYSLAESIPNSLYMQAFYADPFGKIKGSNTEGTTLGHQWTVHTASKSWTAKTLHGVAVLNNSGNNSGIFLMGGKSNFGTPTNDVHHFDGLKWTQLLANDSATTSRFSPRADASVAEHGGRLWVGFGTGPSGSPSDLWSSADGKAWTKANFSSGPGPRVGARAVSFNGKLYIVGGYSLAATAAPYLNEVWAFDSGNNTWSKQPNAPWQGRYAHAVCVHNGRMYVIGGSTGTTTGVDDVWSTANGAQWTLEKLHVYFKTGTAGQVPNQMKDHDAISFQDVVEICGGQSVPWNFQFSAADGKNFTVPLEHGGPGFKYGNDPVASASKDKQPDVAREGAILAVFNDILYSIGGYGVNSTYNDVIYSY